MRRVDSFGLKISKFLFFKKVCVISTCSMREYVENRLIKYNQPSAYMYLIIIDRWAQKRIQNPVKPLSWSIIQKYLQTHSC